MRVSVSYSWLPGVGSYHDRTDSRSTGTMPEPLLCRRYIASQLCWPNWLVNVVSGVEFYLRNASIPTDGSGRLLITDIRLRNGQINTSDEDALICRSSGNVAEVRSRHRFNDWYLDPELVETNTTLVSGRKISEIDDRGWTRNKGSVNLSGIYHQVVRLKRVSETTLEGKFTCHIQNDRNNNKSLLVLYPSELMVFPHT